MWKTAADGRHACGSVLTVGALLVGGLAAARAGGLVGPVGGSGCVAAFTALTSLAWLAILLRALVRRPERRGWLVLGLAVACNMLSDALAGWSALTDADVVRIAGTLLGIAAFPLAVTALVVIVGERLGRLPLLACVDGLTGALVFQTAIAVVVLGSADAVLAQRGVSAGAALLFPLADVLVLAFVAAAAAQGGWRLDGWTLILAGIAAIAVGDGGQGSAVIAGTPVMSDLTAFAWLVGAWLLAAAAWAPTPRRGEQRATARGWIPLVFSVAALALLLGVALSSSRSPLALALGAAGLVTVITRFGLTLRLNARVLGDARRQATTDALTGLGNRRQLTHDLELALGGSSELRPAALVLYDLNGFKDYNDSYGHPAGDALLATLGGRLAAAVAGAGTAYRMGGDEFCVLIAASDRSPAAVAEQAAAALAVGTERFSVTAAYGLVRLPADAADASRALRLADVRMYEQKAGGRLGAGLQVAHTLMLALEERDVDLHEHVAGVETLATEVALGLGLPAPEVERIRLAALLHDVGKIAIPDHVLHRPGPLDEHERELMRSHTLVGQRIIDGAPSLHDVGELVRASHEHLDGSGYPDGLAGEAIPIGARIISVCDAFGAMTETRAYRRALPPAAALTELERCAGTQFDAAVVALFVAAVRERRIAVDVGAGRGGAAAQRAAGAVPAPLGGDAP